MIPLNSDLIELLAAFESNAVRYLIIGGYAVGYHAEPRFTKDFDLRVATDEINAVALHRTLKEFGAPLFGTTPADFQAEDAFFFFGAPPNRIDILMGPPGGIAFDAAWTRRIEEAFEGVTIYIVSRNDLISLKRAAGREIDVRDIAALLKSEKGVADDDATGK